MSEDLRKDHVKLESPSILIKKILFARPLGGWVPCSPCLRHCRTIGKQSRETVESVLKKKRKATVGRICGKGRF